MEDCIGATQLIEYIEEDADGSYCKLMGWPSQTDLSLKSFPFNSATLESWYPDTTPTAPSALMWTPYKIVKTIPHVIQPGQGHPLHGTLRYHKGLGWHYRYSTPFRVDGRPSLPSSMISRTSPISVPSIPKVKKRSKKPLLKIKRKAYKLTKLALSKFPELKLRRIDHPFGGPELKLRRIDQQPGFRSLYVLLNSQK